MKNILEFFCIMWSATLLFVGIALIWKHPTLIALPIGAIVTILALWWGWWAIKRVRKAGRFP
jgi:Flp pilus assembly protein TadB